MVPLTYTQWLGVNKNHGTVPNLANLKVFYGKYVKPELDRLRDRAWPTFSQTQVEVERQQMLASVQGGNYAQAQQELDTLIVTLNGICRQLGEKFLLETPVVRYRSETGQWSTNLEALAVMDQLASTSGLPTRKARSGPEVPGIKWSTAKTTLPKNLVNLIRDIRNSSRAGRRAR